MALLRFGSKVVEQAREDNSNPIINAILTPKVEPAEEEDCEVVKFRNYPPVECGEVEKQEVTYGVCLDLIMDHVDELSTVGVIHHERQDHYSESVMRNLTRIIELTEGIEVEMVRAWSLPMPR